ncbi:restriction endonuclease, SacI family [Bradyrhizobium sp. LHD-71]|uniref:restriction endonuclease, SacI family n=1 Tax=Bradyrhizobium sp. LHD-71 TaxID=3072141 RepID=UPI00280C9D00|nr:restriction endonuclease, SacI family [Bradyrhizobium sp. LHD-71]MDQ8727388.1 restriction endonuclease, SacI family [Bradyrhizobium sp. LHD-71]
MREEAARAAAGEADPVWIGKVERLSQLCADGVSATHIAFLGTAMLAKAADRRADLFAIKPTHAKDNPNAFSARILCHGVLVPLAAELGFNIGVTGREPLNNQPYFRMTRLDDGTPVHAGARAAFNYMVELVRELDGLSSEAPARDALRAFIAVRLKYQPRYLDFGGEAAIAPDALTSAIIRLVLDNSEGGRRAQAVVAGLMDAVAGPTRVESGRINDPSRKYPGDVCVRSATNPDAWEKALEVRDKPVTAADVQIFGKKCVDLGVREAAVVMVSEQQERLDRKALNEWAHGFGIGLTLFQGWPMFVDQALFWSGEPKPVAAGQAVRFIHQRLVAVEASPEAVALWQKLVRVSHDPFDE